MDFEIINDKFHRIIFRKYKIRKIRPKDQTIRNLLCYYQAIACQNYPTEDAFNIFQQEAYDMRYTVSLTTVGVYSVLTYTLQAVDPRFIEDKNYTYASLERAFFLCMEPFTRENNFDLKIFKKAKEIYLSNLLYQEENEAKTATSGAISTYFKGTIRDFLPDGSIDELKKITCRRLYSYYLSIQKDEEATYVAGNISNQYRIENRSSISLKHNHFFRKRAKCDAHIVCPAQTGQAYLEIIYDTKIFPNHNLFYAVSFLNYCFGGSSNSKLFTIVREKYGLCYSISSTHFGASGILLVSAIIRKEDTEKTLSAIDEAWTSLLEDINLEDIRNHFIMERRGRADYLQSALTDDFMDRFFPDSIPTSREEEAIGRVTISSLRKAYQRIMKSLVYVYGGDANE